MRTQFGEIGLMRCSIAVRVEAGSSIAPNSGKGVFILRLWDGLRRRTGFHHPTHIIPFILFIHANCSSPVVARGSQPPRAA